MLREAGVRAPAEPAAPGMQSSQERHATDSIKDFLPNSIVLAKLKIYKKWVYHKFYNLFRFSSKATSLIRSSCSANQHHAHSPTHVRGVPRRAEVECLLIQGSVSSHLNYLSPQTDSVSRSDKCPHHCAACHFFYLGLF